MDYEVMMNGTVRLGMKMQDFEATTTQRTNKIF